MKAYPQKESPAGLATVHQPVLREEVVSFLAVRPGGIYLDGTVGTGGHGLAILEASAPAGLLLGLDLDREILALAQERLAPYGARARLVQANHRDLDVVARSQGFSAVEGVLLDLGLCSVQLTSGRGFSFREDAPLDMRRDQEAPLSAADLVNHLPAVELARLLAEFGEEPRARRIARWVVERRPIRTARELALVVAQAVGSRGGRLHPATRTFQALRIAVNGELEHLRAALEVSLRILQPGGRLVVISYHSLEDRIVKEFLRREARGCQCPPEAVECRCGHVSQLRVLTRRPLRPAAAEVAANPGSRSARLRAAERLGR